MSESILVPYWLHFFLWLFSGLFFITQIGKPLIRRLYHNRLTQAKKRLDERLDYGLANSASFKRETWIDRLLDDDEVKQAIQESSNKNKYLSQIESRNLAREIAEEIIPSFNALLYLKVGYWFSRNILRLLFWVQVGYPDTKTKSSSYGKIKRSSSVIIVSNHRSNIDPLLLVYMAFRQSVISFSAGEWARGTPIRQLIHAIGFYIIRRDNSDPLYRCVLKRYVHLAVSECVPQGLFIEGALSKDGNMQPAHLGLLNYQLKAMGDRKCKDIVFVPAAINYDKFPEDKSILDQLTNNKKEFKNRSKFFSHFVLIGFLFRLALYIFPRKYKPFGYAAVNFGNPLSVSDWQDKQDVNLQRLTGDERKKYVSLLGKEVEDSIKSMMPVLPVPILATVLLSRPLQRITKSDLKSLAYDLVEQLQNRGHNILVPEKDLSFSLDQGIVILQKQNIIKNEENEHFSIVDSHKKLLSYYANSIGCLDKSD